MSTRTIARPSSRLDRSRASASTSGSSGMGQQSPSRCRSPLHGGDGVGVGVGFGVGRLVVGAEVGVGLEDVLRVGLGVGLAGTADPGGVLIEAFLVLVAVGFSTGPATVANPDGLVIGSPAPAGVLGSVGVAP